MLGFTVPLFVLLGIESLLALLLLGPRSLAGPALFLCKSTRSSVRTPHCLHTASAKSSQIQVTCIWPLRQMLTVTQP